MPGVKGASGGRNKLPTELKQVRGTEKPSRANPDEPKPTPGFPFPPKTFTRRQRECYEDLIESLKEMNITTHSDGKALAQMALILEEINILTEALNDDENHYLMDISTVVVRETKKFKTVTRKAAYMLNPSLKARSDAQNRFIKLLTHFGMTPQSRSGVKVLGKDDGGNEFFN